MQDVCRYRRKSDAALALAVLLDVEGVEDAVVVAGRDLSRLACQPVVVAIAAAELEHGGWWSCSGMDPGLN